MDEGKAPGTLRVCRGKRPPTISSEYWGTWNRDWSRLKAAVTLPCLPESLRKQFPSEIQKGADRIQSSLEASAAQDRSGQLQHLLQLYPVNRWEENQNHEQPK